MIIVIIIIITIIIIIIIIIIDNFIIVSSLLARPFSPHAQYGFDQQRLIWYVFRLLICYVFVCSDEGLTLKMSAMNHIPQAKSIP